MTDGDTPIPAEGRGASALPSSAPSAGNQPIPGERLVPTGKAIPSGEPLRTVAATRGPERLRTLVEAERTVDLRHSDDT